MMLENKYLKEVQTLFHIKGFKLTFFCAVCCPVLALTDFPKENPPDVKSGQFMAQKVCCAAFLGVSHRAQSV